MSSTTVSSPTMVISTKKLSSPTKRATSPRKVRFQRRAVPGKSCLKNVSAFSPAKKIIVSSPTKAQTPKQKSKNVNFATPSKIEVLIIPADNRGRKIKPPHTSIRLLSPQKQRLESVEAQVELAKVRTSATKKLKVVLKMFRTWKQAGRANEKRMFEIYDHLNRLGKSCTKEERLLLRKPIQAIILEMEKLSKEEKEFLKLVEMAKVQKQAKEKTAQPECPVTKQETKLPEQAQSAEDELVKGLTKQLNAVNISKGEQPATYEKFRDENSIRMLVKAGECRDAQEPKTQTKIPAQPKGPSPPKIATTDAQVDDEASLRTLMAAEQSRKTSPSTTRANPAAAETKCSSPPKIAQSGQKACDADEDDGRPKWWHPIFFFVMLILIWASRHD